VPLEDEDEDPEISILAHGDTTSKPEELALADIIDSDEDEDKDISLPTEPRVEIYWRPPEACSVSLCR
jgi:hypothetical protein